MHEIGLCAGIAEAVLRRTRGRAVVSVKVRVGGHPVDPAVITQGFQALVAGTEAEGATVEVDFVPSALVCARCGAETVAGDLPLVACPSCGELSHDWVGHETAVLESVTFASATGPLAEATNEAGERAAT